ncbi:hypothetical protein H6G80_35720 [Nostoc sp. FACHB-87]|nr:hypothetical protein [Nostoc sp. FACHB-190]MBD2459364.1 hypothetical protein [Nostoc sp. FACHB-87]MBD2480362.1 hypothetical protein [Anabaena sp. FACHB-83]MBD2492459.1 hypothetical protein [Aulosira sp. FACHB-615]
MLAPYSNELNAIAERIRQRYDYQLKQEIEQRERTIDIQVDKTSNTKALKLASEKLKNLQAWNQAQEKKQKLRQQSFEQFKSNLFYFGRWVGSGRSGTAMFFTFAASTLFGGLMWGFNEPSAISCPSEKSLCYQLRLDKKSVILPAQKKQILEDYQRSLKQPRRRQK